MQTHQTQSQFGAANKQQEGQDNPRNMRRLSDENQPQKYVTDIFLSKRYGVTRQTIWRWAKTGILPHPKKLSPGCTRWCFSDVVQLMEG